MVNRLNGQKAQWLIGSMVDRSNSERLRGFCDGLTDEWTFAIFIVCFLAVARSKVNMLCN